MLRPRLVPLGLSTLVCALIVVRVAGVYDALPARMASHFNYTGRADGSAAKGTFVTTMLLLQLGTLLVLGVLPALMKRLPAGSINLPHRDYWLAPGRRAETVDALARALSWIGFFAVAQLALTLELTLRANLDGTRQLPQGLMYGSLGTLLVATLIFVVWTLRRFTAPPVQP